MITQEAREKFGDHAYRMLPLHWRQEDHSPRAITRQLSDGSISEVEILKFHNRFFRAFGDAYDELILDTISDVLSWLDATRCDEDILPYRSRNIGWPLDTSLPYTLKRQILRNAYRLIYLGKGNLECIRLALLAFTGLQVQVWAPNNDPRALILMKRIGITDQAIQQRQSGIVSETAVVLQTATTQVSVGDMIMVQHGDLVISGTVQAMSGTRIVLQTGNEIEVPAGAKVFHVPPWKFYGKVPPGLGKARLAISSRQNLIRLGHNSLNNVLGGTARLGRRGEKAISDAQRAKRFTFYITVPVTEGVISAWKLRVLRLLANYMRPERTHYSLRFEDIGITEPVIHLGSSMLGGGARLGGTS